MKFISIVSLFYLVSGFASAEMSPGERFNEWLDTFDIYLEDNISHFTTFDKWLDNDEFINNFNAKNATHVLGHNQFSGMDRNDYKLYLGYSKSLATPKYLSRTRSLPQAVVDSVNWVEKGGVTPVKDQGQCGSCWSFSTTGALEGAYFVKKGTLQSFSEQQLVDCDTLKNGGRDMGCNGGLMDNAFNWIKRNGGLCTESDYPYKSGDTQTAGTCSKTCSAVAGSSVVGFVDVPPSDDTQMMAAIMKQPVSIAIEADQREFQLYKSGVFKTTCGTTLDHGVLVVGYGTESNGDYYLVKNSWGDSWGDNGYIKLARGKEYNGGDGQCGLLLSASYPIL